MLGCRPTHPDTKGGTRIGAARNRTAARRKSESDREQAGLSIVHQDNYHDAAIILCCPMNRYSLYFRLSLIWMAILVGGAAYILLG
jgi:hypothetical protein